jgi:shikimate dehydrogenase
MIRGTTRVAAVIGWPVEHSRSPQMFEAAFAAAAIDAVMIPIGVPPESLAQIVGALRAMRALGASVTLPHKLAAAALCGHNTDCHGFADALVAAGFAPEGKRCVILGSGGAARAVAYGLRTAGASGVDVIARHPLQVTWTTARSWTPIELRASFSRADLVVDTTPMGLTDDDTATIDALPLDTLRREAWVSTLVYHRPTRLLERAAQRGMSTLDGRGMLVHQGARAFALWTGAAPPIHAMRRALDAALAGT